MQALGWCKDGVSCFLGAFETAAKLQSLSNTNIGYHELQWLDLFDSNEQLLSFMRYYSSFDFLGPKVIKLDPQALSVRQNEERVAWMLGMNPPNSAQHAKCNGREWKNQHQHKDGKGAAPCLFPVHLSFANQECSSCCLWCEVSCCCHEKSIFYSAFLRTAMTKYGI